MMTKEDTAIVAVCLSPNVFTIIIIEYLIVVIGRDPEDFHPVRCA